MTPLPLFALFALQALDPTAPRVRVVLAATEAHRMEAVPGMLIVTSVDTGAASLRLTTAAPARAWWRSNSEQGCPNDPRGEPVLVRRIRLVEGDAFYFCVRPETDAPLRVVATARIGSRAATTVAVVPRNAGSGLSTGGLAVLTAILGLVSGIAVNYATSRNQLRNDLAKQEQENRAREREKRLQLVEDVNKSILVQLQRAMLDLRAYADSPVPPAEHPPQLKLGGMQIVKNNELVKNFFESGEGKADFDRLKRVHDLLSDFNLKVRNEDDLAARRRLALNIMEAVEALHPG